MSRKRSYKIFPSHDPLIIRLSLKKLHSSKSKKKKKRSNNDDGDKYVPSSVHKPTNINRKRSSARVRALSKKSGFGKYDTETRRQVQLEHLASLENDNWANEEINLSLDPTYVAGRDDDEMISTDIQSSKKMGPLKLVDIFSNYRSLEQILFSENFPSVRPSYFDAQVGSSILPPRHFCSVCGFYSSYTCIRCGLRFCSLNCNHIHRETRCIKFAD